MCADLATMTIHLRTTTVQAAIGPIAFSRTYPSLAADVMLASPRVHHAQWEIWSINVAAGRLVCPLDLLVFVLRHGAPTHAPTVQQQGSIVDHYL